MNTFVSLSELCLRATTVGIHCDCGLIFDMFNGIIEFLLNGDSVVVDVVVVVVDIIAFHDDDDDDDDDDGSITDFSGFNVVSS